MNIKQAEVQSGVSKRNIRNYDLSGLSVICPGHLSMSGMFFLPGQKMRQILLGIFPQIAEFPTDD